MNRWLNILIFACVLLSVSSLKADEPEYPEQDWTENTSKAECQDFSEIKIIDKRFTLVSLMGDANKRGLDNKELTEYLMSKIRDSFTNIKIEEPDYDKYAGDQVGLIYLKVWILGDSDPMVFHINCELWNNSFEDNYQLWNQGALGFGSAVSVNNSVKESIGELIQSLATQFYKDRREL